MGYDDTEVSYREPCPKCREHGGDYDGDNLVRYSDGHGYCFACDTWFTPTESDNKVVSRTPDNKQLLPFGEYKDLSKRGLKAKTLQKFGYSISLYKGTPCHIAPYYDQDGVLSAQHIRFPDKNFIWVGSPRGVQMFGQTLWRTNGKRIVITEGEIDCMSISQVQDNKWPVISIPSGVKSAKRAVVDNLEYLLGFEEVVFCFDNDGPGREAALECAALLPPGRAKIAVLPLKDASDMLQASRGSELVSAMWDAKPYRPDGIVSATDLLESLLTDPPKGYTTPYPKFDAMVQGLRKGELVLWTAGSGIGKSTVIHEIGKHLVDAHGLKIGIMALEESKKRTLERYIGIELNKPIHTPKGREQATKEEITEAFKHVTDGNKLWFYDHFGSAQIDVLLSKIRYMIKAIEIDFLILDHISIVVSGISGDEGERKTIDILMTALRSLIEETQIGVLAIVHLKRPEKGKSFNEGRQVSLTDLRGSASLEQLSDVVVALERDQQSEEDKNLSTIRVLKSRLIGEVGVCDTLQFSPDTGRLLAVDAADRVKSGAVFDPCTQDVQQNHEEDF
jgi:twinkle protein